MRTARLLLVLAGGFAACARAEEAPAPAPVGEAPVVQPAKPEEPAPEKAKLPAAEARPAQDLFGIPFRGSLSSQYRARWTAETTDQDLYELLSFDMGDAALHKVTGHFQGRLLVDLDGKTGRRGYYTFDSVADSSGSDFVEQVYSAYLDFHRVSLAVARAGRQTVYGTPETSFFDGLRAETEEQGPYRMTFGLYGGVPVHIYRSPSQGDAVAGAFAQGRPWKGARARMDWQHLEGRSGIGDDRNNLLGFGGWQSLGRHLDLHARYSRLDGEDRDFFMRGSFQQPDWDFRFQSSYYELLKIRRNVVLEADAYQSILKDYVPYFETRWLASKGFGEHVNLDAGVDWRRLTHPEDQGAFNREFDRYFVTPSLLDLMGKGSSISLTQEVWSSPGRRTESTGLDLTLPLAEKNKVSVGTAYALYKYDYYLDRERDDVRSYYLKLDRKHSKDVRWSVGYEFQNDGFDHLNELRCEVTCAF